MIVSFQIAEKDTEIVQIKEKLKHCDDLVSNLRREMENKNKLFKEEIENCKKEKKKIENQISSLQDKNKSSSVTEEDVSL